MEGIIPWSCFSTAFQSANYQRTVGVVLGALMAVLVLVLVADWIVVARTDNGDSSSEALQAVACLILIELHLLAIVLLYDLEYNEKEAQNHHHHHDHHHDSDSRRKNYKPPIESFQIDFDDMPTISNITTQPSEEYDHSPRKHTTTDNAAQAKQDHEKISDKTPTSTSNYTSMASISTALGSSSSEEGDYYDEQHRSFPCLFGFSLSNLFIFLFLHLASAALFLTSLNQQVLGMNLSLDFAPKELIRNIFLLTYGFFLASSFLSYFQRYLEHVFDISGMQNLWFKLVLSTLAALIALFVVGHAYALQKQTSLQLHPFQYSTGDGSDNSKPFVGEAWASGAYLIDDQATCETNDDALPINVTVAYGSEWACPNLADMQCEITVTSQVECTYLNSFLGSDQYDDAVNAEEEEDGNDDNPNDLTLDDYINFRFHEYNVDDDKNEYSFEEKPSFDYWNRPSEGIIGSCTTCAAMSEHWMTERFQAYAQSNHTLYLVVGMALCFLAWPLYEFWRWWAR